MRLFLFGKSLQVFRQLNIYIAALPLGHSVSHTVLRNMSDNSLANKAAGKPVPL